MRKTDPNAKLIRWAVLVVFPLILMHPGFSQQEKVDTLVVKVAERMSEFPEIENYEAEVSSMLIKVDKNWKAKKTTVVEKIVRVTNGEREEEILSAVETEKGKSKDVTQKQRDEVRKQQEKARKKRAERKRKGEEENSEERGGRLELTYEEMFPFNEKRREKFTFRQHDDTVFAGKRVLVLESKSKIRSDRSYEGTFYIDPDNYEVLRAFIKPAKNPSRVKKFEIEILFQVLPEGFFVPKETRARIHVGLVIKSIRMEVQEVYKTYKVLGS